MSWLHRLRNRLRRRQVENEIAEEIRFHLAARVEDNVAAGLSPEAARQDALRRFGSAAAAAEATRDTDLGTLVDSLGQDLRFAARSLRRHPGFALLAVLTLAVGTGASTAIFTLVRGVVLRPLPFPAAERLVAVSYAEPGSPSWLYRGLEDRDYVALDADRGPFESVATFAATPLTLTGAGDATRVDAMDVTAGFFRVLGVAPAAGGGFAAGEAASGDPVCSISDRLWRTRYASDPHIIGRRISLDGASHTVVAVMPAGFAYPEGVDIWRPFAVKVSPNLTFSRPVIARLSAGTTVAQARAAFATFMQGRARPDAGHQVAEVTPLGRALVGDARRPLLLLAGAVALVLLIAVANAANLLLMRAVSRSGEIATRLALGAGRRRLMRLLLVEGGLVAFGGAALGVVLAALAVGPMLDLLPPGTLPRAAEVRLDAGVVLFAAAVAVLTTLLVSLASMAHSTRTSLVAVAQADTRTATPARHRLRHALVVLELAMALILLSGAALLGRGFLNLRAVDPGFATGQLLTMTLDVPSLRYDSAASVEQLHARLLVGLRALPGAVSVGAVNWLPLEGALLQGDIHAEGPGAPEDVIATKAAVSPGYFATLGIRLRGRDFADADGPAAPRVAIVSDAVARRLWPGAEAIGQRLAFSSDPAPEDWHTVIGVAGDVRNDGPAGEVAPAVYRPLAQTTERPFLAHMTFAVRTAGEPASMAAAVRAALAHVDPGLAPQALTSMDARLSRLLAEPRFQAQLVGAFAAIALALAALGVYGVLAASVGERQREMGIRIALGADAASVVRLVLRRTATLSALGIAAGTAGAALVARLLSHRVFAVGSADVGTFVAAAALLFAISLLAGFLPARRASRTDPLTTLRAS